MLGWVEFRDFVSTWVSEPHETARCMGCWCGRRVHRLPQSVWDEFVVGLNLSAEAGMSVDEGSGEDRDQCLF